MFNGSGDGVSGEATLERPLQTHGETHKVRCQEGESVDEHGRKQRSVYTPQTGCRGRGSVWGWNRIEGLGKAKKTGSAIWDAVADLPLSPAESQYRRMTFRCSFPLAVLLSLFVWALCPAPALARVFFSEILWPGSDLSASDEWLELSCIDQPETMSGYLLTSVNSSGQEVNVLRFPEGTVLQPLASLLVSHYPAASSRLAMEPQFVTSSLSLPNTKLKLRLYDAQGTLLDEADDGVGAPMAGSNASLPAFKASMERLMPLGSGSDPQQWKTSTDSQGLDAGASVYANPGYFLYSSFSSEPYIEQQSSSSEISSGSVYSSSDSSESSSSSGSSDSSFSSALNSLSPSISSSSESTSLSSSSSLISSISSNSSISSLLSAPLPTSLHISEILPDPVGSDDAEWVEIRNADTVDADLRGWTLREMHSKTAYTWTDSVIVPAGGYRAFRHSVTGVTLPQAGGEVQLQLGGVMRDSLVYPDLPENVSYGRPGTSFSSQPLCIPTEGAMDREGDWDAELQIQSGALQGEESVSLNTQVVPKTGSFDGAICHVSFGDGGLSDSCNPPSHTYDVGDAVLTVSITNYCGTTVTHSLSVSVSAQSSRSSARSSSSVSRSSSSQASSASSAAASSTPPIPPRHDPLMILDLLPNPEGKDAGHEWVTILNAGAESVPAQEIRMRVAGGSGQKTGQVSLPALGPHEAVKISGSSLPVSLTNEHADLQLLSTDEYILDTVSWATVKEKQIVGHPLSSIAAHVVNVVDGDTVDVEFFPDDLQGVPLEAKERIRLIGVNTPELHSDFATEKDNALKAKEFISTLLLNTKVELEFDTNIRDMYGRLLAYVSLADDRLLQKELVVGGYAVATKKFPHSRLDEFLSWITVEKTEEDFQQIYDQKMSSIKESLILTQPLQEQKYELYYPQKKYEKIPSNPTASPLVLSGKKSYSGSALPSLFADIVPQVQASGSSVTDAVQNADSSLGKAIIPLFLLGLACLTAAYLGKKRFLC